jgi:pyruvate dehydrogenase E2 component (dihydrolipoamide acetyltransferase)
MSTPIRVPRVGQNMTEATLVSWERSTGDAVAAGDVVATIETDKTEIEVEAPSAGVLGALRANEGDMCGVGTLLAYVLLDGEREPATDPLVLEPPVPSDSSAPVAVTFGAPSRQAVSPRARRVAAELGVDLAGVVARAPDGIVTEADVRDAATSATAPTGRRRPFTHRERAVARNLATSWTTAPHFTQMVDVDVTAIVEQRGERPGVTFNDVVVHALSRALRAVPQCNVRFDHHVDGDGVLELDDVDIAIAVDTPDGLAVPVVRRVDTLDRDALAQRTRELVVRARANELTPDDVGGASASVSNLGAYGIRAGTAVLPVDHAAIVFVGAIEPRAVVRDGAIVVRSMCTLSITYDHRVVDGAAAARLTVTLASLLEQEESR